MLPLGIVCKQPLLSLNRICENSKFPPQFEGDFFYFPTFNFQLSTFNSIFVVYAESFGIYGGFCRARRLVGMP